MEGVRLDRSGGSAGRVQGGWLARLRSWRVDTRTPPPRCYSTLMRPCAEPQDGQIRSLRGMHGCMVPGRSIYGARGMRHPCIDFRFLFWHIRRLHAGSRSQMTTFPNETSGNRQPPPQHRTLHSSRCKCNKHRTMLDCHVAFVPWLPAEIPGSSPNDPNGEAIYHGVLRARLRPSRRPNRTRQEASSCR
jgi:hypothetical protein